MENVCRVCTRSDDSLMDIFSKPEQDELCPADMLIECVDCNVHLEDQFPKKICLSCFTSMQKTFKLKRRYEQSHQHFCQLLNINNIGEDLLFPECEEQITEQFEFEEITNTVEEEESEKIVAEEGNGIGAAEEGKIDWEHRFKIEAEESQLQEPQTESWQLCPCTCREIINEETTCVESNTQGITDANDDLNANTRTSLNDKTHLCDTCDEGFPNNTMLILHSLDHFDLKYNLCPYCTRTFCSRSRLEAHVVVHSGELPFKCPHCQNAFRHKSSFNKHILTHSGDQPFKCPRCKKTFRDSEFLHCHMRTHLRKRSFKCSDCPKSFDSNKKLEKHIRLHSSDRPFKCPQCVDRFRRERDLRQHIISHSKETLTYACCNCRKTFKTIGGLNHHNRFICKILKDPVLIS